MRAVIQSKDLAHELVFLVSRSSGPGGQNVNKVNSKVTLKLDVNGSSVLQPADKELLLRKLASKITQEGILLISVQESRSQLQNKMIALQQLDKMLTRAYTPEKIRKKTRPSKSSKQERVNKKKRHGEKKQWRRKI